ncbi:ankyrin repeat domain-containing protein [Cocleimonas flava]|uniref:Uncharacterized protein n=1 Tax=Cocleimonas flava TaxID=634765 RepID=A0A4R1F5T1_9GAMM|nr:ankyrin repeat domain-containing protein [Cocleimonas flava]TCJ88820.1 hypothetical protein EV695_0680 [Cocleimonas flava]
MIAKTLLTKTLFSRALLYAGLSLLVFSPLSLSAASADTSVATNLSEKIIGNWCLNEEKFMDDSSFSGEIWEFTEDGKYTFNKLGDDAYTVTDDTVKLDNFGTLKVLTISDTEMVAKVYSTYYFSKDRCADETLQALKLTQLNNAIIMNNLGRVEALIKEGIDVSKPDTRGGMHSTPLMVAIRQENEAAIELILKQKPDLTVTNFLGKTALDIAMKSKSIKIKNRINDAY